MRDENLLWLQNSDNLGPQVQMRAVFVALISKFQSVIAARRKDQIHFDRKSI